MKINHGIQHLVVMEFIILLSLFTICLFACNISLFKMYPTKILRKTNSKFFLLQLNLFSLQIHVRLD
jgi:hypothetical protein